MDTTTCREANGRGGLRGLCVDFGYRQRLETGVGWVRDSGVYTVRPEQEQDQLVVVSCQNVAAEENGPTSSEASNGGDDGSKI